MKIITYTELIEVIKNVQYFRNKNNKKKDELGNNRIDSTACFVCSNRV